MTVQTPATFAFLLQEAVTKPGIVSAAYSAFTQFSIGNQLLAWSQCMTRQIQPGPMATYPRWRELGRHVKRGEKAITWVGICFGDNNLGGFEVATRRRPWYAVGDETLCRSVAKGGALSTLHKFPVQRKPQAQETEQAFARALRRAVDGKVGVDASFEVREVAALELTNEATRLFLLGDLMTIADSHGEQIEVDGVIYQRHQPGTVRYFTLCGALDIERWTYREVGVRNGATIVPLDLEAGIVEHGTPALGFRIALGYAKDHMRSCEEDMKADHRSPPSRSTLERMAKAIGTEARRVAPRIEPRLRRAEVVPDGAVAMSMGLDRTSVPMEESRPAGEAPATPPRKPYERTPPDPVNVNYRMAYVGTITFHDVHGDELGTRFYTAAAHESPTERVVGPLMAALRHALRQAPAPDHRRDPGRCAGAMDAPHDGPRGRAAGHDLLRRDRPVPSE